MGLPDGLDAEVIIGYLMVFILSVIVLVYLGYDISWFIASSKKKKRKITENRNEKEDVKGGKVGNEKVKKTEAVEKRKGEVKES